MHQFKYTQLLVVFRKYVYILALVCFPAACLIWLPGCKRCNDIPTYTRDKFVDVYPGFMGFEGHETLTFLKNGYDTVYFKGQGLQVYNETKRFSNGDCEADFILLHHKVIFSNKKEGDFMFHYYKAGKEGLDTYEILFQNQTLIKPIEINRISVRPLDSAIIVLGHEYKNGWRLSPNNIDSVYFNGDKDPRYRVVRVKLNNMIYEVIP